VEYIRRKRIVAACLLIFGIFLPIFYKLGTIQLVNGAELAKRALYQRSQDISLEGVNRGNIYDRKLRSLSDSGFKDQIVVFPDLVTDKEKAVQVLARVLTLDQDVVAKRMEERYGVWPYTINELQEKEIRKARIAGVLTMPVRYRYGSEALAANLIGYLGKIGSKEEYQRLQNNGKQYRINDSVGKMGLERYYEGELKGRKPERVVRALVDAKDRLIPGLGIEEVKSNLDSTRRHVVLTIDWDIQQVVEEIMDGRVKKGAVVVMDAKTGDLLALASRPTYNQNSVQQAVYGQEGSFFERTADRTVLFTQPGSVFKVVIAAAAINEGLADDKRIFNCRGQEELVRCNISRKHQYLSLSTAMALSCNPTFVKLGLELGSETVIEYAGKLGLNNQNIIGYPLKKDARQDWSKLGAENQLVNSSIGQGPVLTTPVQITAMMNTFANGGMYIQPRLVKEIRESSGQLYKIFPLGKSYRAISPDTAQTMKTMLERVVTEGTGKEAAITGWQVAGKTGTAEVNKQAGTDNAWFSGYAPANDAKYVVTVLVEDGESGGITAAPVFRDIVEKLSRLPNDN
jgi:penicillin-binding protein 2